MCDDVRNQSGYEGIPGVRLTAHVLQVDHTHGIATPRTRKVRVVARYKPFSDTRCTGAAAAIAVRFRMGQSDAFHRHIQTERTGQNVLPSGKLLRFEGRVERIVSHGWVCMGE